MNWVPGDPLSTWDVDHPMSLTQIQAKLMAIGAAIAHLHSGIDTQGIPIVHGDLKPSNVIVGERVTVVDFGLAQSASAWIYRGETPGYAAPEITAGGPPSVAGDIFALGSIAYYLVVGASPPEHYDADALRTALAGSALAGQQPGLIDHILWAMAKDPVDRPPAASDWAAAIGGTTTPTGAEGAVSLPPAPEPSSEPESPRRSKMWTLLAVLAMLALVGGAALWNRSSSPSDADGAPIATTSPVLEDPTTSRAPTVTSEAAPTTTNSAPTTTTATPTTTAAPKVTYLIDESPTAGSEVELQAVPVRIRNQGYAQSGFIKLCSSYKGSKSTEYNIDGRSRFQATLGLDDDHAPSGASVQYQVLIDDVPQSPVTVSPGQAVDVDYQLDGAFRVKLMVTNLVDLGDWCDYYPNDTIWAAFGDARFVS
ncbi:NPCBM/NEW2 domain-containing protein [Aquihabitans daechungensis]|uniref:protein kinase domain-containing protein n=1 Tax=Aquihabitans daechungensis TaxID=1052257 RepID=UPI003B9F949D